MEDSKLQTPIDTRNQQSNRLTEEEELSQARKAVIIVWLSTLVSAFEPVHCEYRDVLLIVNLLVFRIFFALASPVFYAMLYGPLKEQGDVDIEDVSVDAFRCLQKYGAIIPVSFDGSLRWLCLTQNHACFSWRYIYTDSFDAVSVANAVDVLAASKKYLMAKLTRYCYGYIQNNITAENSISLWTQV